jgi:DNA-binding GntR family transcriptional regulator
MTTSSLALSAHRQILRMILEGNLKPGEVLQEAVLGERLEMSRTPVREAIKRIQNEGLAEAQGRFTKVRQINHDEIEEIFFIRLALEPDCARNATGIDPARLDEMESQVIALMRNGPSKDDLAWHIDDAFHNMIALAANNRSTAKVISSLHARTCIFDHSQVPARFLKGCAEHLDIIDALRNGEADRAESAMRDHLEHARDAIFRRLGTLKNVQTVTK